MDLYSDSLVGTRLLFILVCMHAWNCVAVVVVFGVNVSLEIFDHEVMEIIRWNNCWNIARRCAMQ